MKKGFLKLLAFLFAGVYLARCAYYASAMLGATQRNFSILMVFPAMLGIALFVVYGVRVSEKTRPVESVIIGVVNIGMCVAPLLMLSLMLSPLILLTLPSDTWIAFGLPMLMSIYPFAFAIWKGHAMKREMIEKVTKEI